MTQELALSNGVVTANSSKRSDELSAVLRRMSPREKAYVQRLAGEIGDGVTAIASIEKEITRLKKKVANTPEGQKIETLSRKLRQAKQVIAAKVERAQGVIEMSCDGDASPAYIVADAIPEPPKQLKGRRK